MLFYGSLKGGGIKHGCGIAEAEKGTRRGKRDKTGGKDIPLFASAISLVFYLNPCQTRVRLGSHAI